MYRLEEHSRLKKQTFRDTFYFWRSWTLDPLRVGAILPSSRSLAKLITSEINAKMAPIIELGAGTGVFTEELIARGVPESALTLVERDIALVRLLSRRFPSATVAHADAWRLKRLNLGETRPGAFVSGLPLVNMPSRAIVSVLRFAFAQMRRGGSFYQFTYMPYCPISGDILDRVGLHAQRIGGTFANVPPASVYRLVSRADCVPARNRSKRRLGN
jgi:phosphatidylethanolamine/phosphatidyl-N-methylethanolamine N-methyltransferase